MASSINKTDDDVDETVGSHTERFGRSVERFAEQTARDAVEAAATVSEYASDGFDRFEVAVRRNPLASAAIAAGVGFVLAALARR